MHKQYPPFEFRFFTDDGHGWLEVPLLQLLQMGIAHEISRFSYMKGDYVYLEEDIDINVFLSRFTNDQYTLEHFHVRGDAPIRQYKRFRWIGGISDIEQTA